MGLVLTGLVASGLVEEFPPFVRFLLTLLIFSWLPGEVLRSHWLGRWGRDLARYPFSLLLGLSVFSLITWLCMLTGATFGLFINILQGSAFLLYGVFFVVQIRRKKEEQTEAPAGIENPLHGTDASHRALGCMFRLVMPPVALAVAAFYFAAPPSLGSRSDAYDHIGYIRAITTENKLEPTGVLSPIPGEEAIKSDPRKGSFHGFIAAVCVLSRTEIPYAWVRLPVVFAPAAVLAFAAFSAALLPGAGYAFFALLLFMLFQGGLGHRFYGLIAYGQNLSLVYYALLFVLCLGYGGVPKHRRLVVIAVLLVGGSVMHLDVLMHAGLMIAALIPFRRTFGFTGAAMWRLVLVSTLSAAIVLAWKLSTSYGGGNAIHLHPQGLLYFMKIGDPHFIVSPIEILRKHSLVFLGGILMVPGLFLIRRHRRYARMCFALSLPPILLALNPWVTPLLSERMGYLVQRFVLNIPAFAITVLVLGSLVSWAQRGAVFKKLVVIVLVFAWCKFVWLGMGTLTTDLRRTRFGAPVLQPAGEMGRMIDFVNERIPAGAVVLSDPVTSYTLSAYTDVKVVTLVNQHANPNDVHALERVVFARQAMSAFTSQIELMQTVRRFGVHYVVLNGSFKRPIHEYMADWNSELLPALRQKFEDFSGAFRRVYRTDGISVYRFEGSGNEEPRWFPIVPFVDVLDGIFDVCGVVYIGDFVEVEKIRVDPQTAVPGEKIKITVVYRKVRDLAIPLPLRLYLRFENAEYFETSRSFPGDKLLRRYRERRDAAFQRFRIDRTPFDGLYTADMWPVGHSVHETFSFRLPTDLHETRYEILYRIEPYPLIPNFTLRDLLFNDDSFVGRPCSEIEIRNTVTR